MSDADLIARVLVYEDRTSFGELVRNHQSAVRHFLRHLTRGDAALADDLAQETFVTAWRTLARYNGGAAFATWLLGIAHNHWRNARRRERPNASHERIDAPNTPEMIAPAATASADLMQDLAAALAQLPGDERVALHLHYQQGLSHPEIAGLLDWPLGTVKTNIARGKDRLRELLAAWNPQT